MNDAVDAVERTGLPADERLVELASRGNHDAFAVLVEARFTSTLRTATAILGSDADARDAVQDAFISAWVHLPRLRDAHRFDAWFARILVNCCRDALRRKRHRREVTLDGIALEGPTDEVFTAGALSAAFDRLDVPQRHLLILHHLHRMPLAEIGRQLGIPVGTAKWRLYAARRALERALEGER